MQKGASIVASDREENIVTIMHTKTTSDQDWMYTTKSMCMLHIWWWFHMDTLGEYEMTDEYAKMNLYHKQNPPQYYIKLYILNFDCLDFIKY